MTTILLCESDRDVRRLLLLLLERLGYEVVAPSGGATAIPPAALMLLEPASPTCLDLARRARAEQPDLPILCVSVLPDEGAFLALGPLAFLPKPFSLDELRVAIDAAPSRSTRAAA